MAQANGGEQATTYGRAVTYEEKLPKRWTVGTLLVLTAWVIWQGTKLLPEDSTVWLVIVGSSALFAVVFNGVPLSKRRYNRIRVRDGQLTVGRETIPVASLTPESIREAREQPPASELMALLKSSTPDELAEMRRRSRELGPPRLMGGAWAVPLGMEEFAVETEEGEALLIATHDRERLLEVLGRARQQG
ncbi:hypothetical protein IPZ55_21490 [Streptomyces sp. A10(2020)]|uniref:hypothetical protein n=1 Tax=Streptomyces TaxID=1883 RepID=UPI0003783C58|nr:MULTISPECIES: hypothetical protein [Streptomyces]UNR58943.1 hypothetical protein IPZ55_21490 [Streptomyces sp. A10(2020)]WJK70435.1 hypothetical protein QIA47_29680 [Streptomyces albidoflavus]WSD52991.1 hypothetical protein OHA76_09640 [Streptomyces albidoflavus]WTC37833.1 hypothetical protein OH723_22055 [Streptomyces albidoflavus]WTC41662.1 hypothetical protein OH810_08975 [Streptomyces albidoflavus]